MDCQGMCQLGHRVHAHSDKTVFCNHCLEKLPKSSFCEKSNTWSLVTTQLLPAWIFSCLQPPLPFLLAPFIATGRVKQLLRMPLHLSKERMHKYPTLFIVMVGFFFVCFCFLRMNKYTQDILFIQKFILPNIQNIRGFLQYFNTQINKKT